MTKADKMTKAEKMDILIKFCSVPRRKPDMMDKIGALSEDAFRRTYLVPLLEQGILVRLGRGPAIRYVRADQDKR